MQLQQDFDARYLVKSYGEGYVGINDVIYRTSLVITPEGLQADWPPETMDDLRAEHLDDLLAGNPEVILLGTGCRQQWPAKALLGHILKQGRSLEVMDTAAACRTFNILVGEGRRVSMGLLMC